MAELPRIFVASSSERIQVAKRLADALEEPREWDIQVWDKSFNFSASYMESLERELDRADFAMVVLTGDDAANVRQESTVLPRDNVIFELGLFIGRLGRSRCFFFVDAASSTQIASDLSGVKAVSYSPTGKGEGFRTSLGRQANLVKRQLRELGIRYKPSVDARKQQQTLWQFSSRLAGCWWERMKPGEDDQSALSYVHVSVDPATNTPRLEGQSYDHDGRPLAKWWSVTTGVIFDDRPKVHYRWEGGHEGREGQLYGGHAVMHFDSGDLDSASGYFFDTNFALLEHGALTRVKHCRFVRCAASDQKTMQTPASKEARALLRRRLESLRW